MVGDVLTLFRLLDDVTELLNFVLVLLQKSILWVLVDSWLILDHLGSRGVTKGSQGLIVVEVGG